MNSIGGYFSLELPYYEEYHRSAIKLNTGRNCLEYIFRTHNYTKVYIPYYTCEVLLQPFIKLGIPYEFYHINCDLELTEWIPLKQNEALLYTNYYGLKYRYAEKLSLRYGSQLILDNTQAFFEMPIKDEQSFYSCRKFFGVPDGSYLYTDKKMNEDLEQDRSFDQILYLSKRIELGAEAGYVDFCYHDDDLRNYPIKRMARFTERMMQSIDYMAVKKKRRSNYERLHKSLRYSNRLKNVLEVNSVPMVYPYLTENKDIRQALIQNKVYVAKYWPNVEEWVSCNSVEVFLSNNLIPIPIDQRYGENEMDYIIKLIRRYE